MKQTVFFATVLISGVIAGSAMAQMSGALSCERNAQQVRDYIKSHESTLPQDKQQAALERLSLYEGQCNDQSDFASTKLSELRGELGMPHMQPQSAQTPEDKGE